MMQNLLQLLMMHFVVWSFRYLKMLLWFFMVIALIIVVDENISYLGINSLGKSKKKAIIANQLAITTTNILLTIVWWGFCSCRRLARQLWQTKRKIFLSRNCWHLSFCVLFHLIQLYLLKIKILITIIEVLQRIQHLMIKKILLVLEPTEKQLIFQTSLKQQQEAQRNRSKLEIYRTTH